MPEQLPPPLNAAELSVPVRVPIAHLAIIVGLIYTLWQMIGQPISSLTSSVDQVRSEVAAFKEISKKVELHDQKITAWDQIKVQRDSELAAIKVRDDSQDTKIETLTSGMIRIEGKQDQIIEQLKGRTK